MNTIIADLWDCDGYKVIPTNMTVRKNGSAVMGAGLAKQAATRFPFLPSLYGNFINRYPLNEGVVILIDYKIVLFPTKDHWKDKSAIERIQTSCFLLAKIVCFWHDCFYIPPVGCGLGEMSLDEVMPILEGYLPTNFTLVLPKEKPS